MTTQQQPRYITGHGLQHEGGAHDAAGRRHIGRDGRGKCACGVLSEPLPSKSARQRWHKEHKAEVLAALQETPAPAFAPMVGRVVVPLAELKALVDELRDMTGALSGEFDTSDEEVAETFRRTEDYISQLGLGSLLDRPEKKR